MYLSRGYLFLNIMGSVKKMEHLLSLGGYRSLDSSAFQIGTDYPQDKERNVKIIGNTLL